MAGVPGQETQGQAGNILTHNFFIENEQFVNKNNPLQNSLKTYTYEMKMNSNTIQKE